MALKLIDPVNQMPFFQGNQVLTYNHLNDLAAYLYQQERYTRNKLIGSGIVCGQTFSWRVINANTHVQALIDEGVAITSAGYLIVYKQPVNGDGIPLPYTHKRNFTRLKQFEPFKSVMGTTNPQIHELITLDMFNAETDASKSLLLDADKTNRVLILLYDIEALNIAKCLDEGCDDKGKIYQYTPRPLLVPMSIINNIVDADASKPFYTEPGRAAKGKYSYLFDLGNLRVNNLFKNGNLQAVTNSADIVALFQNAVTDADIDAMGNEMDELVLAFPWVFAKQLECLKAEIAALGPQTVGTFFAAKAKSFRNSAANNRFMQYLYDFVRDVTDSYNELLSGTSDLVGECGGNELIHPFHVMLGVPLTKDVSACYEEGKYTETNFKYRHYFVPSPVMDTQYMLYEKVQSNFKRLVRIISAFGLNPNEDALKVTPSRDYDNDLGERALPYFYLKAQSEQLKAVWDYNKTRTNKISRIKGFQLNMTQDQLLDEDTRKNDFYRIEGHIGRLASAAANLIDGFRAKYNLPFTLATVSVQNKGKNVTCSFSDLDEEYLYYADRVRGYLREIELWLELTGDKLASSVPLLKPFITTLQKVVNLMKELLNARCISDFNYNKYKEGYAAVWSELFKLYAEIIKNNLPNANHALNKVQNIMNIIFFRPIYKIWFMYKYRLSVLAITETGSLQSLATQTTGLEHLAGVRRGETFLMVSDEQDVVIADFNLPDLMSCSCDCRPAPCDGKHRSLVSPLQKPIVMVVDSMVRANEPNFARNKAYYDGTSDEFVLELDAMGFYKADSDIKPEIEIFRDKGKKFPFLRGIWEDDKMVLRFKQNSDLKAGIYALHYVMAGDFDENTVEGLIILIIIGQISAQPAPGTGGISTVPIGPKATRVYPYDKTTMKKTKPGMRFNTETKTRTIGGEKVEVYTSPKGNEMGIYKDSAGLPYIKVLKTKTPGVEEVPFILDADGGSMKSSTTINIIDKKDQLNSDTITGIIKDETGTPVKDAKVVTSTGKEMITNEKGEYTFNGMKAGEVLTVERKGYKTTKLQMNSTLESEVKLEKAPFLDIRGLEDIKLPDSLSGLKDKIDIGFLKNLMK